LKRFNARMSSWQLPKLLPDSSNFSVLVVQFSLQAVQRSHCSVQFLLELRSCVFSCLNGSGPTVEAVAKDIIRTLEG
jgi:hypothetical protein